MVGTAGFEPTVSGRPKGAVRWTSRRARVALERRGPSPTGRPLARFNHLHNSVGTAGLEPATPGSRSRCATKLRLVPFCGDALTNSLRPARTAGPSRAEAGIRTRCLPITKRLLFLRATPAIGRRSRSRTPLGRGWNPTCDPAHRPWSGGRDSNPRTRLMRPMLFLLSYLQWGDRPESNRYLRGHDPALWALSHDHRALGMIRTYNLRLRRPALIRVSFQGIGA